MGKYFSIEELTRSATATAKGINNDPDEAAITSLTHLIEMLDKIRITWGEPIRVNSGYRCIELNTATGGVPTSQHSKGQAADITAGSEDKNKKLFDLIVGMKERGIVDFDQLIDEKNYRWLHISTKRANNRNQILHLP